MKPILYTGALLMIGASIYGFVDYKKTSHDKRFKTLYNERTPVSSQDLKQSESDTPLIENAPSISEETTTSKTTKRKNAKRLNSKLYSRAALERDEPVKVEETEATVTIEQKK